MNINNISIYRLSHEEIYFLDRMFKFYNKKVGQEYRLPEIYFGEFEEFVKWDPRIKDKQDVEHLTDMPLTNVKPDLTEVMLSNPDYLGVYISNSNEEGKIYLYKDRIKQSALRFYRDLNMDYELIFEILCFIVLFHELGHWLTHWICRNDKYSGYDRFHDLLKETQESMAQLNVLWTIHGLKNKRVKLIRKIFYHLVDLQPAEYQIFQELDKNKGRLRNEKSFTKRYTILNRYLKIINQNKGIPDDFYYLLYGKEKA